MAGMNRLTSRLLAFCTSALAAFAPVLCVGAGAAEAAPCQRSVIVAPEVTAAEGAGTLTFTVYSAGCAAAGEVGYAATAGTAQPGADFTLASGTLRWSAGETGTRTIIATIADDPVREDDLEGFTVTLAGPSADVEIVHGTAYGRVLDDDGPWLAWAVDDGSCPRPPLKIVGPGGAPPPRPWSCELGHDIIHMLPGRSPAADVMLHWGTADGTAHAGVDYVPVTDQVVTVPAGTTEVGLPVQLLPGRADPSSLWFLVRVTAISEGNLVDAVAVVTIDAA
jgi:hypothetical protein